MSKRTSVDYSTVSEKNFWNTPLKAALPLIRALPPFTEYDEPCAGAGRLVAHMAQGGHRCVLASDIRPKAGGIWMTSALDLPVTRTIVTNPPFTWPLLQPLLDHWIGKTDVWLLLPWDMVCNIYMAPYSIHIDRILPLGRVSWMDNGKGGFENYGWFHFSIKAQHIVLPRMEACNTYAI